MGIQINQALSGSGALLSDAIWEIIKSGNQILVNDYEQTRNLVDMSGTAYTTQAKAIIQAGQDECWQYVSQGGGYMASGLATTGSMIGSTIRSNAYTKQSEEFSTKANNCETWENTIPEKLKASSVGANNNNNRPDDATQQAWLRDIKTKDLGSVDLKAKNQTTNLTNEEHLQYLKQEEADELQKRAETQQKSYFKKSQRAQAMADQIRSQGDRIGQLIGNFAQSGASAGQATAATFKAREEAIRAQTQYSITAFDADSQLLNKGMDNADQQKQAAFNAMVQIMQASHA